MTNFKLVLYDCVNLVSDSNNNINKHITLSSLFLLCTDKYWTHIFLIIFIPRFATTSYAHCPFRPGNVKTFDYLFYLLCTVYLNKNGNVHKDKGDKTCKHTAWFTYACGRQAVRRQALTSADSPATTRRNSYEFPPNVRYLTFLRLYFIPSQCIAGYIKLMACRRCVWKSFTLPPTCRES
jgi:hypothetical protein